MDCYGNCILFGHTVREIEPKRSLFDTIQSGGSKPQIRMVIPVFLVSSDYFFIKHMSFITPFRKVGQ